MKKYIALILSLLILSSTSIVLAGAAVKSSSSSSASKPSISLSKPAAPAPAPAPAKPAPAPAKPLPTGGTVSASKPEASKPLPTGGTVSSSKTEDKEKVNVYTPKQVTQPVVVQQQSSGIHWGSVLGGAVIGSMLSGGSRSSTTVVHQNSPQPYASNFNVLGLLINLIILAGLIYAGYWVWNKYGETIKAWAKDLYNSRRKKSSVGLDKDKGDKHV